MNKKDFENAKLYVDLSPCNECTKEIIQIDFDNKDQHGQIV